MTLLAADFSVATPGATPPETKVFSLDDGLTPEGARLLRSAVDISLHRNRLHTGEIEERITIWGRDKNRFHPAANFTRMVDEHGYWSRGVVETAFASFSVYEPTIRTVLSMIRAKDKLSVVWAPGALTNEYMRGAVASAGFKPAGGPSPWREGEWTGLHGDSVSLIIDRPATPSRKAEKLTFMLGVGVTPDNSARMIRSVAG